MIRRSCSFIVILFASLSLLAQDSPNLQNGMPAQGSYDGGSADTVNLMNGNLTLHIPLPISTPQRGKLGIKYYLVVNAKTWKATGDPATLTGQWKPTNLCTVSTTGPCGQGPVFLSTATFGMTREWQSVFTDGVGTDYSVSTPTSIATWDGSAHGLTGSDTVLRSTDTSGYRVEISGSDGFGLPDNAVVIDRNGTRYSGTFVRGGCTKTVDGGGLPGSTTTTTCPEYFNMGQVTDANGNVLSPPVAVPELRFDWTTPAISTHAAVGTEVNGCVTSFGTPWVGYLDYPAANGQTNEIKLCFAVYPQLVTSFSPAGIQQFQAISSSYRQPIYLSNVILPDNTQWSISYDSYGEITNVTTPTGALIAYGWAEGQFPIAFSTDITSVSRAVHTRSLHDVNGNVFTWTYQWGAPASDHTMTHTVTDPNNNDTVHVFKPIEAITTVYPQNYKETSTVIYQGTGGSRTPLEQVDTTWLIHSDGGSGVPTDSKTTLFPSLKAKLVHRDYDPSSPPLGVVVSEKKYDWGNQGNPGGLLREQDTVYEWQKDSRYLTANLLDLPASTIVVSPLAASNIKASCPADGAGTLKSCMAETDFTYDEPSNITSYENTVGALPTGTHLAPANPVSGNLTTVSKWLNTGAPVVSHTNWYDTGEPHIQIDPLGHTTTTSYDLAYNGALPTKTCNPKNQCVSATYDVNSGLISSFTDANGAYPASGTTPGDPAHTSTYGYDFLGRMTSAVSPADSSGQHPQTTFEYPNLTTVQRLQAITSALTDTLTTHSDGLGHVTRTEHLTPDGTVMVDTSYDGLGHVTSVTNPYITSTDVTYGTVQTAYDALGRPATITEQDASVKRADYSAGNCVTSFDEAGTQRKSCSDALGQLVEVDEPNPTAPASFAQATMSISGTEQSNAQAASSGTATVTIGGAEYSSTVDPCQDLEPPRSCPKTTWDIGSVTTTVNGVQKSASYGQNSTPSTVTAALMAAFHNDTTAPVDASCSDSLCTNPVITLTARATGVATNYSLSASPSQATASDFWATPSGSALTGGRDATSNPDTGAVTATINGTQYQVSYGGGDDAGAVAQRLAAAISAGSLANATASGGTITLKAKSTGPGGDYAFTTSYSYDAAHFSHPSFTTSPASGAMSGGFNADDVGNSPYVTLYQYDALGNLLRVDQKGSAPSDSSQWRTRTFTYDSLSRLLTAHNPESGTITYSYDADSNLLMKTSPAPNQTGTVTQPISYCYDELHRLTKKDYQPHTFSPPACPITTPVESYAYDAASNAIGHLTSLIDQAGSGSYTYDPLGRSQTETRIISGVTKTISYDYNLDGSLSALHYPSGRSVTYVPDYAGRVTSVSDSNGTSYGSNLTYWPNGTEYQWHLPNIYFSTTLNKRLQISGFYSDNGQVSSFFMNKTYSYGPAGKDNGNVISIINNKDATRTQTYTYDALNRITSGWSAAATGTLSWGENYTIDAWGNLMISPMTGKTHGGTFQNAGDANNHASGLGYDAAGNLTNYSAPNQYVYDPENRIQSTGGVTYTYDADGNRVEKSGGTASTLYWYGAPGIIAESDLTGVLKSEYIFVNGKRAARIDAADNSIHYYLSDHLNSTSMVISAAGIVEDESDYSAFGTEYPVISSGENHYKFSGKERDTESQLDYFGARYYSNLMGRFITPDWADKATTVPYAEFSDPQSLNLYTYVRNVPTTRYDSDGHFDDPFNVFGGDGLFDDSDRGSNIESSHIHRTIVTTTTTTTTVNLPSLDGTTPGPTITKVQEDVTVSEVGVAGTLQGTFIPRHLTDYEKQQLAPYVSQKDLDRAIIHVGQTPKYGILPFPFPSSADAVTVNNNIYLRRQAYDPEEPSFLGLVLSHELYHVFQYRTGIMTPLSYLREAATHGSYMDNKFERPAYDFGQWVYEQLVSMPL